jgi:pimeloyl-ACP methyl ester carboxylesterase
VPQAGHMVFVDQPTIYLKAIEDFLQERQK